METKAVCIKVSELRKAGYKDLEEWLKSPENEYVGRRGRIFITESKTEKRIFHYSQSKWANPYKVGNKSGQYSLEESINLYKRYLIESGLIKQIKELKGKNLGCFCMQDKPCHAQVLAELVNSE